MLQAQAATRVQELVPIRYGRMLASPFTFYRGAAAIMAADLAQTPGSGIVVQACGDAHISNFGGFAVPDRRLVFGPNDFDETLPGPWEWDVKRMAASVEIAGRDVDLPAGRRRRLVTACVREYREGMRRFANESHLDVWYDRLNASELVDHFGGRLGPKGRILFSKPFAKARRKTSLRAVEKLTERVHGELRFRSVPPLFVPLRELFDAAHAHDEEECVRELIAEVVKGQRISQAASDIFLGWSRSMGLDGMEHDFYVRQLWDWKASIDLSTMSESGLHAYTRACGWSLARSHARSGDRLAIAAYLGGGPVFERAIARFSTAYADQNELDHRQLAEAVAEGEVTAEFGV